MAWTFDIVAHFDNEFEMPLALFKIAIAGTPLLFHDFNFLFNFDEVTVHRLNFFVPLQRVDFSLDYLMIFLLV